MKKRNKGKSENAVEKVLSEQGYEFKKIIHLDKGWEG